MEVVSVGRKQLLKEVLNRLGGAWPKKELTEAEVLEWFDQIGHLDRDVALKAVSMVISECEWYPTIAKYLECARSILRAQEASLGQAPVLLTETARKIQQQALAAQREVANRRSMLNKPGDISNGHNHSDGWLTCPICVQADTERDDEDCCTTCMVLDGTGLHSSHHKG